MFHEELSRIAVEYTFERGKPFQGSEFGHFVRNDLATKAKQQLIFLPYDLSVKSSVGAGNWAAVPWLAFFDPIITSSATSGYYVVYLINAQSEEIFLSLNQGTTEVYREFGEGQRGRKVLKRRALEMSERIPEFATLFDLDEIDLGSSEKLPAGYEAGHSFGRRYSATDLDPDAFLNDFETMLAAYSTLVDRGGRTPIETMMEESGTSSILETRRYVLSRRIERAPNVRVSVLERRGACCEACGMDPVQHYDYSGPLRNIPLDVHHSRPIRELSEGETRRYKIPDDFLVLCPTCHRVIHQEQDPSNLDLLQRRVKFEFRQK